MCPCDTWTMEKVTHGKMDSRVRGSFLSLEGNPIIQWGRKKEKKRRKNKKERRKSRAWRRGEKKEERHFPSLSSANRRSKLVRARGKVGVCDKGYVWVTKYEFFVEVPKGRSFSYIGYFLPSGHARAILVQL